MMNQEPDFGSLMPDTFADLGNTSYGAAIDDYQAQMDDFDLKGPNAQFIASSASYDEESTSGGGGGGGGNGDAECEAALAEALEDIAELETALDEACDQAPAAGSWSYGQKVYKVATSGTCSGYAHFQREQYSASLAQDITFLGNAVGNGYRLINNTSAVALYRVYNVPAHWDNYRRVIPVRTDQLKTDGSAVCNAGPAGISLRKVDPAQPSGYGPRQEGIAAGAAGIGTYIVVARTLDTIDGTGPWYPGAPTVSNETQIGTMTKSGDADVFDYEGDPNNPCGDRPPPFYTVNYVAGTGGTIDGLTEQYIEPGGTGTPVIAVADSGFTFVSWSDGQTAAARPVDSNPTSNGSITANFIVTP